MGVSCTQQKGSKTMAQNFYTVLQNWDEKFYMADKHFLQDF